MPNVADGVQQRVYLHVSLNLSGRSTLSELDEVRILTAQEDVGFFGDAADQHRRFDSLVHRR